MADPDLGFSYRYQPAGPGAASPAPALLLLHEGGGNEDEDFPVVDLAGGAAAVLRPQGKVDDGGLARYFRRREDGSYDPDDLHRRAEELAGFVAAACQAFDLDPARVWVFGFSHAAVMAAALALDHPDAVAGGVLLNGAPPFATAEGKLLADKAFFCGYGRSDPGVTMDQYEELVELLVSAGAEVELHWYDAGHEVSDEQLSDAADWLTEQMGQPAS
ncbi:MAG: dienelactone hydrolase family protein [Actinomycetota bacterium]|nr:dienelactone hydrolase family protein [Actinomycetota bacterium]